MVPSDGTQTQLIGYGMNNHPQRLSLHNEIHARPPEPLPPPVAVTHVVMLLKPDERAASHAHFAQLLRDHHLPEPQAGVNHMRADMGAFRLRWEMHTEFVSYTFMRNLSAQGVEGQAVPKALEVVPTTWLDSMPGELVCHMHVTAVAEGDAVRGASVRATLRDESLTGAVVADSQAVVFTDFAIQADGATQMLVLVRALSPRRLGRLVQRLLEIETYRMMALLGLPIARDSAGMLSRGEAELASLAQAIRTAKPDDEPALLDRLTRLAGEVEGYYAATHSRFSASSAYFDLVMRRIDDIAEERLEGLQSIKDFMQRRLTPAMSTCDWSQRRQQALSERISRMSNLLRTRVEIEQQDSSRALLATMNQRQELQLKLQSTVEGLSVAAITYYLTGLLGYVAKGGKAVGWPFSPEMTMAVAVPVIALMVWWMLKRLHKRVHGDVHT